MQNTTEARHRNRRARGVLAFVLHQLLSTLGVAFAGPLALIVFADLVRPFGWNIYTAGANWILTQTPYFPVQIAVALLLGWLLGRLLSHTPMVWVWVLPLAVLSFVVAAFPTIGQLLVPQYAPLSSPSRLSHFFGWGCQPRNHCLDQMVVTMPFYSAAAYSIGAWIGRRVAPARGFAELIGSVNKTQACLLIGLPCLCVTLASAWLSIRANAALQTTPRIGALMAWATVESAIVTFLVVAVADLAGRRRFLKRIFLTPETPPSADATR